MSVAADVAAPAPPRPPVRVARWPSELPLFLLALASALLIWLVVAISVFGAIYAAFIVGFLFFAHVVAVVHIRGSGVKLGEDQLPELHRRVVELARAAGIRRIPDAYVMQEGGALNAFATKLLRSRLIVLYSDLLEACGDDHGARDMVIGHELGHVKCGHLDWMWLLAPTRFIPFLGGAYSRACELTCDRWGAALCGDRDAAVRGLVILAAGARLSRAVDLTAFARQQRDLDTGWMTLGRWLSTYPPLCARVATLDEALAAEASPSMKGPIRALAILASGLGVFVLLGVGVTALFSLPALRAAMEEGASDDSRLDDLQGDLSSLEDGFEAPADPAAVDEAMALATADLVRVGAIALEWTREVGNPPDTLEQIETLWNERHGPEPLPRDPFDGALYGYYADETDLHLWSSGPDGRSATDDDIDHVVTWSDG